ncbi:MAG: hypothetical protein HUK15_00470, partial [Bacteroidales bacterium]|nr:hypothetical protein [Bacteroidales bacterium]
MKLKPLLILVLLLLAWQFAFAQDEQFVQYRHENGNISSEGTLRNGKPDGFWKNYYEDGQLKSEGKRTMFELDSVWNFYSPDGQIEKTINYRSGKKNGYTYTYTKGKNADSVEVNYLESKELFLNGIREGISYFYTPDGCLQYAYKYVNDKRDGESYEFDCDSTIISIITYRRGYLAEKVKINRSDESGRKQGRWVEFYPTGEKKTEMQYFNGKIHGLKRDFDNSGRLIAEQRYVEGNKFTEATDSTTTSEITLAEYRQTLHPNGQIKTEGAFMRDLPIGIHKEYDENGKLTSSREYTNESVLVGEGMYDANGNRSGTWKLYDGYWEYFYAEGKYYKGKKEGLWKFYYSNGEEEMR